MGYNKRWQNRDIQADDGILGTYTFTYRGERTVITNMEKIKVNGIELTTNLEETNKLNL